MLTRTTVFAAVALASAPALAQQQDMDFAAMSKAPQGAWAEYSMTVKGQAKPMKMRYALVEKTDKKMVVEVDTDTPMGAMQMRLDYEPAGPDAWKVSAGHMKMGTQSMDVPKEQLAKSPPLKKGGTIGDLVGTETIKTPAGSFECKHYKKKIKNAMGAGDMEVEMWMSEKAMPTGLVRSVASAQGIEIVLSNTGKDAKPSVAPAAPATPKK